MGNENLPEKYEVLIFCSDQHAANVAGFMGDTIVKTPYLDAIAAKGAVFENAYTSCPLCAPARASFMTARVPSRLGMFNNSCDFKSSEVTFAHLHALAGYESVLIGRMHFNGLDYYHGFTKRVGKDLTGSYWGYAAENRKDLQAYAKGLRQNGCLEMIGSGDTPVREYDRQVISQALEYLSHDYHKPQLMVVGTYGPHFPYVGDEERMKKYREPLRAAYRKPGGSRIVPAVLDKMQQAPADDIVELRTAYYALVEEMDDQVGQVYAAFQRYLARCSRPGIFIYLSDHGDQLGHRNLYGKQTFFEGSAGIPLIVSMEGSKPLRVGETVSIMDIGPTLCALNGAGEIPGADGKSFLPLLEGIHLPARWASAEFYEKKQDGCVVGRMVHRDKKKLICYDHFPDEDLLFDTEADPEERDNLMEQAPALYRAMKELLAESPVAPDRREAFLDYLSRQQILSQVGEGHPEWNPFTYTASERVRTPAASWIRPRTNSVFRS